MTQIPIWWLILSGIFFFVNTLMFVVLTVALFKLIKFTEELSPRVKAIEAQIQELIVRLQAVAKQVEEATASVKQTVDTVGGRARGLVGTAEVLANTTGRQIERLSPIVAGVMTAVKIVRAVQDFRSARNERKARKAEPQSPHPQQKKGLFRRK